MLASRPLTQDERIVAAAKGDDAAFEALVKERSFRIRYLAQSYFGPGLEIDDLRQAALVGLMQAVKRYDPDGDASFDTFSALMMERRIIDAVNVSNRQKHDFISRAMRFEAPVSTATHEYVPGDGPMTFGECLIDPASPDPHEAAETQEDIAALMDAFTHLSKLERQAIILQAEGHEYTVIAEKLNVHLKSVDNAVQRGRRKVAEYMEAQAT